MSEHFGILGVGVMKMGILYGRQCWRLCWLIRCSLGLTVLYFLNIALFYKTMFQERSSNDRILFPRRDDLNYSRLFYNSIPRAASRTFAYCYLDSQSIRFGNYYLVTLQQKPGRLSTKNQKQLAELIMSPTRDPEPLIYTGDMYFLNFTKLGQPSPIYISMVRDPIQRIISLYKYERALLKNEKNTTTDFPKELMNVTFEQCLKTWNAHCAFSDYAYSTSSSYLWGNSNSMVTYFCGYDPVCQRPFSSEAFQLAKANIESHYTFIGLSEWLMESLKLLEHLIPVFKGVSQIFCPQPHLQKRLRTTRNAISAESYSLLRDRLKLEFELYELIKQRFCKQFLMYMDLSQMNTTLSSIC